MLGPVILLPLLLQVQAAQPPVSDPRGDHELVAQLLARVQQLEAEVRELKANRPAMAPVQLPAAPPVQPAGAPAAVERGQPAVPAGTGDGGQAGMGMPGMGTGPGEFPTMRFQGFSDVSYAANDLGPGTNTFALGQFTLFITSTLSDHFSVVAEPVLEADERNAFGFELERLLLQFNANQYFSVGVGRYHTAIGWYNTAYHHSTWLQTAIGRPFLFEFEDKGGILPIHNVGVSMTGRIPSGGLQLRYIAEVGNGRSSRSRLDEPVQSVRDENHGKAVNLAILARPDSLRGFQAGFSAYFDRLAPADQPKVRQTILAGHAVYQGSGFEWLNEAVLVRNAPEGIDRVDYTPGFYSQVSRQFGNARPYVRYQYVNVPDTDVYFPDVGLMHGPSLGVRYDFNQFAAFKIQYDRTERRSGGFNTVATQLSFVF
jgi:hypothetical protein